MNKTHSDEAVTEYGVVVNVNWNLGSYIQP